MRELECLVESNVSLLTERRVIAPWGLDGGGDGAKAGANYVVTQRQAAQAAGQGQRSAAPGETDPNRNAGRRRLGPVTLSGGPAEVSCFGSRGPSGNRQADFQSQQKCGRDLTDGKTHRRSLAGLVRQRMNTRSSDARKNRSPLMELSSAPLTGWISRSGIGFDAMVHGPWSAPPLKLSASNSQVELVSVGRGKWSDGLGNPLAALEGAIDIDLSVSPFTNTLPVRRLQLAKGSSAEIRAVYVHFPDLAVLADPQKYTCLEPLRRYRTNPSIAISSARLKLTTMAWWSSIRVYSNGSSEKGFASG